jgi:hypothetical protein
MDMFELRRALISDYTSYVRRFFEIRDDRVRGHVEAELNAGFLWPEPLIQLNPAFEPGQSIDALVAAGTVHQGCSHIYRRKKNVTDPGEAMRLHRHQMESESVPGAAAPERDA